MKVELIDFMGTDLSIVNDARESVGQRSEWETAFRCLKCDAIMAKHYDHCPACRVLITDYPPVRESFKRLSSRDHGLIRSLMRNGHTSPFEGVSLKFRVTCPIFVAREWQRHRTQSYNERSTRYDVIDGTQDYPLYYLPPIEDFRVQVGKAMSYTFEPMADELTAQECLDLYDRACKTAFECYNRLLELGLAKEVARNVLPLATYTEFIATANLLNWFRFLNLRMHPTALREIRALAHMVANHVKAKFPSAYEAWEAAPMLTPPPLDK